MGVCGLGAVAVDKNEFLKYAKGKVQKGEALSRFDMYCHPVGEVGGEEVLPWKKIDFEYKDTDELLKEISKRYDLEEVKQGQLCQILSMLEQGGVITKHEYWAGQAMIPFGGAGGNQPSFICSENLIEDYYADFEKFVYKYGDLYSDNARWHLQESLLAHKKIDLIFRQIQSYR